MCCRPTATPVVLIAAWCGGAALALLSGCYLSHRLPADAGPLDAGTDGARDAGMDAPLDAGMDAPLDAGTDAPLDAGTDAFVEDATVPGCDGEVRTRVEAALSLDLLYLVDNSGSMAAEQLQLARQFPTMVRALVDGDVDLDGRVDFPPVRDLHVGVVTSDMGVGGYWVDSCDARHFGDDGILRNVGRAIPRCRREFPRFLEYRAGGSEDRLVDDFACIAIVGTRGCGFEQQLEAVLKALTPATSETRFFADTAGHGDGANAGFLREESILAVVLVTDEDDCSARDPRVYDLDSSVFTAEPEMRCSTYEAEAMHPVERYVDGLRALRADYPDRFLLAAVVGVPPDLVADPAAIDFDAILADDRMQIAPHRLWRGMLRPSCEVERLGQAFPPRRIVRVARGFGREQSAVQSICQADWSVTTAALLGSLGTTIRRIGCGASP